MTEVVILPVMPGRWRGVLVDKHEAAGQVLWTVTLRAGLGCAPRRHWFPDRGIALAHAIEMADRRALPLFDLSDDDATS